MDTETSERAKLTEHIQPEGIRTTDLSNRDLLPGLERPDRDGCDCPPWVIRCVHFGEHLVVLLDGVTFRCPSGICTGTHGNYGVLTNPRFVDCPFQSGCPEVKALHDRDTGRTHCDDYDAALAAFHAAELELLRGNDD